jgi:hypothetical protein
MARDTRYDPVTDSTDVYYQYAADGGGQEDIVLVAPVGSTNITTIAGAGGGTVTGPTVTMSGGATGYQFIASGTSVTLTIANAATIRASLGLGTMAVQNASAVAITGGTVAGLTSLAVGASGTPITQVRVYTPNLTPASVAANISAEETFAVAGLATTDSIYVTIPSLTAGTGLVGARVGAANTLALSFANFTSSPLTPAAGVYRIVAVRS